MVDWYVSQEAHSFLIRRSLQGPIAASISKYGRTYMRSKLPTCNVASACVYVHRVIYYVCTTVCVIQATDAKLLVCGKNNAKLLVCGKNNVQLLVCGKNNAKLLVCGKNSVQTLEVESSA